MVVNVDVGVRSGIPQAPGGPTVTVFPSFPKSLIHQAPLHSLLMNRATISGGLSSIFWPFRWWAMDTIVSVEVTSMASTRLLRRSQMFFPFNERVFRIFPHYPAWNTARNRDLWVIKVIDFSLQFDVFCWTSSISAFDFCITDIVLLTATILDLISCTLLYLFRLFALWNPHAYLGCNQSQSQVPDHFFQR